MNLFDKVQIREDGPIFTILGLEGCHGKIKKVKIDHQWYSIQDFDKIFKHLGNPKGKIISE